MESHRNNYERLLEVLESMEIIDSHEHLPKEEDRVKQNVDFSLLFSQYTRGDMMAAGMSGADAARFMSEKTPLDEKWSLFEPYYRYAQDGSYCRSVAIATEKFYGIGRLNSFQDAEKLTEKMRKANKKGLYRKVLKDACNIRLALNYVGAPEQEAEFTQPVLFVTNFAEVNKPTIRGLEDGLGRSCGTLSSYVEAVREHLRRAKEQGIKGLKFHFAYMRDLYFAPTTTSDAESVFDRVMEEGYGWRQVSLGYNESRPLQDYMVHRLSEMAGEMDIPVVFHSGFQADMEHNPDDVRPTRLWNLPHRYRNVDFVILHAGMPWMEDAVLLAKHYANVYLDMGWDHIMSPEISRKALQSWIDLVPMNKVIGFGADHAIVEKVYGHLTIARRNIARAFAHKMEMDDMPFDRVKAWIQAIMFDNPVRVFRLEV